MLTIAYQIECRLVEEIPVMKGIDDAFLPANVRAGRQNITQFIALVSESIKET
jgi:hypothetical protein